MTTYRYVQAGKEISEDEFKKLRRKVEKKATAGNVTERSGQCRVALHDVMAAHDERYRKWYKEPPPPVIEDYRCEEAKKTWPGYTRVLTPHGWKEGPPRFKSYDEQRTYERAYGFRQETGERSHVARERLEAEKKRRS